MEIIDISSDGEDHVLSSPTFTRNGRNNSKGGCMDYNYLFHVFKEHASFPSREWVERTGLPSWRGRVIVLDTETTGLDVRSERIVELAAVELVDGVRTGVQFHGMINADKHSSEKALEIHGLCRNRLKYAPAAKYVLGRFLAFLGDGKYSLVAHNKSFDLSILNQELKRWRFPELSLKNTYCSLEAFRMLGESKCSLEILAKKLGIPLRETFGRHSALEDSRATSELIQYIWMNK